MIELNIPGRGTFQLEYLVCDVNGTLALDGRIMDSVRRDLVVLRDRLEIYLVTADTYGRQDEIDFQLGTNSIRLQPGEESAQKAAVIHRLGPEKIVAVGQGANDSAMLKDAALGICVLSPEGTALETLLAADIVVPDINTAFELLEHPLRLVATLRK